MNTEKITRTAARAQGLWLRRTKWHHSLRAGRLTVLDVVGVRREAQRGGAVLAFEAAAVEELALGAQPLHHVDPLLAEIACVAAPQVLRELLLYGALWGGQRKKTSAFVALPGATRALCG